MAWAAFALVGLAAMAALIALRVGRTMWTTVGASLMLGATGYAFQGNPQIAASPARPAAIQPLDQTGLIALRNQMTERYSTNNAFLIAADALARSGEPRLAVSTLLGGVGQAPRSQTMWTALGTAIVAHDGNRVTPPALFAFQQAIRLAPSHPGPPLFLGIAYARAGEFAAARSYWTRALLLTPPAAPWRDGLAYRVALLDRVIAQHPKPPSP